MTNHVFSLASLNVAHTFPQSTLPSRHRCCRPHHYLHLLLPLESLGQSLGRHLIEKGLVLRFGNSFHIQRTHIRITNEVQLELVFTLRQSELQFRGELLLDRDLLNTVERPLCRIADNQPPVDHLLSGIVWCIGCLIVLVILVHITCEAHRHGDRVTGRQVVTILDFVLDLDVGV